MRSRNIKPGFFSNELLGTYDPIISLCFAGLWCLADKDGRLEDRPLRIKAELFPYREGLDVNGYLTVMARDGFITRYVIGDVRYIQIEKFTKHQTPHHTEKSKGHPAPIQAALGEEGKDVLTPLSNGESQVPTRSDSLIHGFTDSLIPPKPPEGASVGKPRKTRRKSERQTITDWLTALEPTGESAIPDDDSIFDWADKAGIPHDWIVLCWVVFKRDHTERKTEQADWRAHFRNAVRRNWHRLWWVNQQGEYQLSTVGISEGRAAA